MLPFVCILALVFGCSGEARSSRGIQVVLITLDTLRFDSFAGSNGRASVMPEVARWAEDATVFERFYAASASTQPSHASMFTGLHPWQHGMSRNGLQLIADHATVAERLRAAGFSTTAVVSSFPVSQRFGFAQGFDYYDDAFEAGTLRPGEWLKATREMGESEKAVKGEPFYSLGDTVTDKAIARIDAATGDRRFFWFHYFDPHSPYGDTGEDGEISPRDVLSVAKAGDDPTPALQRARRLYDADVAYLDRALGRLLRRIEEDAEDLETHVLLVADHGESFGEDGSVAHGRRLIASQIHVPCVLRSPKLEVGVRRDIAGSIDIAATLLSLAGVEVPEAGSGLGNGRDLTRPASERQRAFGMRRTYDKPFRDVRLDGSVHVLDDHLFFFVDAQGRIVRGNSKRVDPPSGPGPTIGDEQLERLRKLFAGFEEELARNGVEDRGDPAVEEGLRALGYLG